MKTKIAKLFSLVAGIYAGMQLIMERRAIEAALRHLMSEANHASPEAIALMPRLEYYGYVLAVAFFSSTYAILWCREQKLKSRE